MIKRRTYTVVFGHAWKGIAIGKIGTYDTYWEAQERAIEFNASHDSSVNAWIQMGYK